MAGRDLALLDGPANDSFVADLATLDETFDLNDAINVGHSTAGGEVAHYLGRHGINVWPRLWLISVVPPLMLKAAANPGRLPIGLSTVRGAQGARSLTVLLLAPTLSEVKVRDR